MSQGKKYKQALALIDAEKSYELQEAVALLSKTSFTKFDPSIEVAIKTNADPKYNDQMIRATIVLPHGIGKKVRIAVYVTDDKIAEVKKLGADVVGSKDLLDAIEKGTIDFDMLLTEPVNMRDLARVAKVLGPRGLMPSPKAGTVVQNLAEAIEEVKKGRIEYKMDKTGNIHAMVGKLSFSPEKIKENIEAFLASVQSNKPSGIKGKLIKRISICTTMGPSLQIVL